MLVVVSQKMLGQGPRQDNGDMCRLQRFCVHEFIAHGLIADEYAKLPGLRCGGYGAVFREHAETKHAAAHSKCHSSMTLVRCMMMLLLYHSKNCFGKLCNDCD